MPHIRDALSSLHSRIQDPPSSLHLLSPILQELVQLLSQAPLFHELCSGDLQALPRLMTPGARLTCLLHLLQAEATALSAGTRADSPLESASGTGGNDDY